MSALDSINFYNPFLENLKKIDGLAVCRTENEVEIHCCMVIKRNSESITVSSMADILRKDLDCGLDYQVFSDDNKGCYLRCYVDNIEYVTIIVQFVE